MRSATPVASRDQERVPSRRPQFWRRPSPDVIIALVLSAAAAALWLPFAMHAGFLYDDLSIVSGAIHFPPALHVDRPLDNLFLLEGLAGDRPAVYYGITQVLASGAVAALYVCLRRLQLRRPAAIIAAATFAIAPLSDSTHLWWAASGIVLSIALATTAIAVGSRWVGEGRRRLGSLVLSELLLAAAVLSFEAVAVLALLPIALIPLSRNRRRTMLKLCADIPVLFVSAYHTVPNALVAHGGSVGSLRDTSRIFFLLRDGALTYSSYVFKLVGWQGGVAGATLATATCLWLLISRQRPKAGEPLLRGLAALAMLLALLAVTWLPLVLVDHFYRPGLIGVGNRVDGVGDVIFAATLGLASSLVGRIAAGVSRADVLGAVVTAGLAGAIVVPSANRSLGDASVYTGAGQRASNIQTLVQGLVPRPRHGDFFLLADYNIYQGPIWVPVLAATWDVTGAMKLTYHDDSLLGAPLGGLICSHAELDAGLGAVAYDRVHVIDVEGRRVVPVVDKTGCESLLPGLATKPYPAQDTATAIPGPTPAGGTPASGTAAPTPTQIAWWKTLPAADLSAFRVLAAAGPVQRGIYWTQGSAPGLTAAQYSWWRSLNQTQMDAFRALAAQDPATLGVEWNAAAGSSLQSNPTTPVAA